MATYQVLAPKPFNFSQPAEWVKWIWRFEQFRIAPGIEKQSEVAQVNTLIFSMGDQADDILHSFSLKKNNNIKAKFDSHFVKRVKCDF